MAKKYNYPPSIPIGQNTDPAQIAAILNNQTFNDYLTRLRLLAMSTFQWENLPDSVSERFLEQTLCFFGMSAFIDDPNLGFLALRATPGGKMNVYNEPTVVQAYSVGYSKSFKLEDVVLIRNNYLNVPTDWALQSYAYRLYDIQRTIDVNVNAQKTPVLLLCEENQRLTLKNMYMQYTGNEPAIFGFKGGVGADNFSSIPTVAPFVAKDLQELKTQIWNEATAFLGVRAMPEKRERLIPSEIDTTYDQSDANVWTMLKTRQEAADAINKKFGLNIKVNLRKQEGRQAETTMLLEGGPSDE